MSDMRAKLGETLDRVLTFYRDEEEKVPLDISEWALEVHLNPFDTGETPPVVLTEGDGFVRTSSIANIRVTTMIDPARFVVGLGHWFVKAISPEGKVFFPDGGKLTIGAPGVVV